MKLKLTMSNAETGEVLHEETDLNFAMMSFGRKTDDGMAFQSVTRGVNMTAADFAYCLTGVVNAVENNLRDNKDVCKAYALAKLDGLRKIVDVSAEARPGDVAADAKKEVEQA